MKRSKTAWLLGLVSLLGLAYGSFAAPALADETGFDGAVDAEAERHINPAAFALGTSGHAAGRSVPQLAAPFQPSESDQPRGGAGWGGQSISAEPSSAFGNASSPGEGSDAGLMLYMAGGALLVLGSGGVTQVMLRRPQI
ncbi:MAG: hypothetical protein Q4D79_07145 [Propionibacteriaceae bacterium]|nr:hypothetical protein [Propionibacteriaceae bacterium]